MLGNFSRFLAHVSQVYQFGLFLPIFAEEKDEVLWQN